AARTTHRTTFFWTWPQTEPHYLSQSLSRTSRTRSFDQLVQRRGITRVTREEFYLQFKELLACLKENQDFSDLTPDTHLWAAGYLDSIGMLEAIERIEEKLGRPLTL